MANEMRLIDANALKDSFCQACSTNKRYHRTDDECRSKRDSYGNGCFKMRLIDQAPTLDAAPVVRCEDCKHCDPENWHCDHPMGTALPFSRKPDDFCSYGERRTNAKAD